MFYVAHAQQATCYYDWMTAWQHAICNGQDHFVPRYHHPTAASHKSYGAKSSIFVINHAQFEQLSQPELQGLFSRRHILINGTPLVSIPFGAAQLSQLCDVTSPMDMHGKVAAKFQPNLHFNYTVIRLLRAS